MFVDYNYTTLDCIVDYSISHDQHSSGQNVANYNMYLWTSKTASSKKGGKVNVNRL